MDARLEVDFWKAALGINHMSMVFRVFANNVQYSTSPRSVMIGVNFVATSSLLAPAARLAAVHDSLALDICALWAFIQDGPFPT